MLFLKIGSQSNWNTTAYIQYLVDSNLTLGRKKNKSSNPTMSERNTTWFISCSLPENISPCAVYLLLSAVWTTVAISTLIGGRRRWAAIHKATRPHLESTRHTHNQVHVTFNDSYASNDSCQDINTDYPRAKNYWLGFICQVCTSIVKCHSLCEETKGWQQSGLTAVHLGWVKARRSSRVSTAGPP